MVKTRLQIKTARKRYAKRSKMSKCKGKGPAVCRSLPGCKYASKGKRTYCRKSKNRSLKNSNNSPGSRRVRSKSKRRRRR